MRAHRTRLVRGERGFTVAELVVTLAITGVLMTLLTFTFIGQQRAMQGTSLRSGTTMSARDAMLELERSLRVGAFGIDPVVAFDFQWYGCENTSPGPGACRDNATASDELVFVARNPKYRLVPFGGACTVPAGCFDGNAWNVTSVAGTTPGSPGTGTGILVTINARAQQAFPVGTQLMFICGTGGKYTMGRVSTAPTALTTPGPLTISLMSRTTGTPPNPFVANDFSDACFSDVPAISALLVDRYRYFVSTPAGTTVPWLMLDQGIDLDGDGLTAEPLSGPTTVVSTAAAKDLVPIAAGIEDLQVAYVMLRGAVGGGADHDKDWTFGDEPTFREEPDPRTTIAPRYIDLASAGVRFNANPGNIRAIRIGLSVTSLARDGGPAASWTGDPFIPLENRDPASGLPAGDRLRRFSLRTTVNIRNMDAHSFAVF